MHRLLSTTRRKAVLIASGTVLVLAVGGGTTAAFAASADGTPATTPAACGLHLRAELLGAMPHRLKVDLKTLRSEPEGERAAERSLIRTRALSGGYGARIDRVAHIVAGKPGTIKSAYASLPAALKTDLKTLRATTPKSAARTAEAQKIETTALDGGYGTTIQTRAKTVQATFRKRCSAQTEQ